MRREDLADLVAEHDAWKAHALAYSDEVDRLREALRRSAARLSMAAEWEWPIPNDGDARSIVRQEARDLAALTGSEVCPECKGLRVKSWYQPCETCGGIGLTPSGEARTLPSRPRDED